MPTLPLACTVRGCGLPLERQGRAFICGRRHSFDVAKAGYVNLLQPQDRKSPVAGDAPAAVDARARLLDAGIGLFLLESVAALAARMSPLSSSSLAVDLGCGTGHLLELVHGVHGATTVGIDLSTRAIEIAARRASSLQWVVANADRGLPLLDRSVDAMFSVNARRNAAEAARALNAGGLLVVAVPAEDDLGELRAAVQGELSPRDRVEPLVVEHQPHFTVALRTMFREVRQCSVDVLRDLLASTYRGGRTSRALPIDALSAMNVTFASDVVVFRKARGE